MIVTQLVNVGNRTQVLLENRRHLLTANLFLEIDFLKHKEKELLPKTKACLGRARRPSEHIPLGWELLLSR